MDRRKIAVANSSRPLVAAQDGGLSVAASRQKVAGEFGLSLETVEVIAESDR